jgi:hypothetical protein
METNSYPALKPTVLIDSVTSLRLQRAAQSPVHAEPRGASVALALGVAVAAGGGLGLLAASSAGADPGAAVGVNCACVETPGSQRC